MTLERMAACGELIKTLNEQSEILRRLRDAIVVSLEDDIRIEELQELYRESVGRMLQSARLQLILSGVVGSEIVTEKARELVSQAEAVYRLVA